MDADEHLPATVELSRKQYEKELLRLQTELVYMQEWIVASGDASWCSSRVATPPARTA